MLNTFVVWFALPSPIFLVIADAPLEKPVDWPFVTATSAVIVTTAVSALTIPAIVYAINAGWIR